MGELILSGFKTDRFNMKRLNSLAKSVLMTLGALVLLQPVFGGQINWVPDANSWNGWTVNWHAVSSLNDPNDSLARSHLDFVGDTLSPGAYWANNGNYVFFRARVQVGTVTSGTFSDTVAVLIDRVGYGLTNRPDFALLWDSQGKPLASHGLEMGTNSTRGATTWNTTRMNDLDGLNAQKGTNDINGLLPTTTNGFIRTIDSQNTVGFGNTTFIDFAVSWDYLTKYTVLRPSDTWRIQFASIDNANDHNFLSYDIAGGLGPGSAIDLKWSDIIAVPEPSSDLLVTGGLVSMLFLRRRRHR